MRTRLVLCGVAVASACIYSGIETDDPLVDFESPGCVHALLPKDAAALEKAAPTTNAGRVAQALVEEEPQPDEYFGLACVAWKPSPSGTLSLSLLNFQGACGITWGAEVRLEDDGSLRLELLNTNPGCSIAACGWCVYDWTFEVQNVALDHPLRIQHFQDDSCEGVSEPDYTMTLPLDATPEGMLCRPMDENVLEWVSQTFDACGHRHMEPCDSAAQATPCNGALVPGAIDATGEERCLVACSDDADCPSPGALSCQDGACRIINGW